jgi:Patatin-like phospholipase
MQDVGSHGHSFQIELTLRSGVLATSVSQDVASHMFRTYDCKLPSTSESLKWMPLNPGPASTSQIWEVARATSAAPTFFSPIHIDDNVFVDGGLMANNPTQEALREVAFLKGEKLAGTCIVSIGSGVSRDQHLPATQLRGNDTGVHSLKDIFRILRAAATKTELTDTDVHFQASQDLGFVYFRFNSTHDRYIPLDEWDKSRRTQTEIDHSTRRYLETEEAKTGLHRCASAIVSKMAGNVHFYAGNVHYFVPRTVNSLFTGRTKILHEIKQCLTSRENDQVGLHRIFVVTGMGGLGKSEICIKLAHEMREEFV